MNVNESSKIRTGCCGSSLTNNSSNGHATKTRSSVVIALLAAMLSSACCWLPLALLAVGASAAGLSQFIVSARWAFIAFALVSLGAGFYFSYRRKGSCTPGATCAPSGAARLNRMMLWISAILVLAMIAYPYYGGTLLQSLHQAGRQGTPQAAPVSKQQGPERWVRSAGMAITGSGRITGPLATYIYQIQGMDCTACAAGLQATIARMPGVLVATVSYRHGTARVQAQRAFDPEKVVKLLDSVGYKTVLVKQGAAVASRPAPAP